VAELSNRSVADTLDAAADHLGQLAGAATPGPWSVEGVYRRLPHCRCLSCYEHEPYGFTVRAIESLGEDPEVVLKKGDAAWFAAANPHDVGLPLAALLRNLATMHRERGTVEWPSEALRDVALGVLTSKGSDRG
jgi:hypothetical protein